MPKLLGGDGEGGGGIFGVGVLEGGVLDGEGAGVLGPLDAVKPKEAMSDSKGVQKGACELNHVCGHRSECARWREGCRVLCNDGGYLTGRRSRRRRRWSQLL